MKKLLLKYNIWSIKNELSKIDWLLYEGWSGYDCIEYSNYLYNKLEDLKRKLN